MIIYASTINYFFILRDVLCILYWLWHVCTSPLMERLSSQVGTGAVACKSSEMIDYFVYSNEHLKWSLKVWLKRSMKVNVPKNAFKVSHAHRLL